MPRDEFFDKSGCRALQDIVENPFVASRELLACLISKLPLADDKSITAGGSTSDMPVASASSSVKRGRRECAEDESQFRNDVLDGWKRARDADLTQKEFVTDWNATHRNQKISVDSLEKFAAWKRTKGRREANKNVGQ